MRQLAGVCLAAALWLAAGAARAVVVYDFSVRLDPAARTLKGHGVITIAGGGPATLALGQRFQVTHARAGGRPLPAPVHGTDGVQRWEAGSARRIEIEWHGELVPLDATPDHRRTLTAVAPASGVEGAFLPDASRWYPRIEGTLARYRLTLDLPQEQRGLVAGRLVSEEVVNGRYQARFDFPHPAGGIDLVAGPYRIEERMMKGVSGAAIRLRTYFHPRIAHLAPQYLESVRDYLTLYESWIGAYPFTEFSVVSSPTSTGFGMPTFTYLGVDVLRLPFIRVTSLGHEVLHNWWGNGVYPDYTRGNWAEGLTTFMADHAYKERESAAAAAEMRRAWLRDFAALPPGEDTPLVAFASRTHGASQIVGYHKAAMVFFMLRDAIGAEAFDRGIREFWRAHRFRVASWDDLRRAFESASERNLVAFFEQWLLRAGAPRVRIAEAVRIDGNRVRVTLEQTPPAWRIGLPLAVRTRAGEQTQWVELARERESFTFEVGARPTSVALDPEARLFRRLAREEMPPILREVMIDPAALTVVLPGDSAAHKAAETLAARLQERSPRMIAPDAPLPAAPLLVIGIHDAVDAWLAHRGLPERPDRFHGRGSAQAWTARRADGATLAVISGRDAEALSSLARPLPHYGRESFVVFDGATVIERGTWPAQVQTVSVE
jgi:aminopeptidase N